MQTNKFAVVDLKLTPWVKFYYLILGSYVNVKLIKYTELAHLEQCMGNKEWMQKSPMNRLNEDQYCAV